MPVPISGHVPPEPPAWAHLLGPMSWLPALLGRPLRVAEPCCGVGCATEALHKMGINTCPGPAWDVQDCLREPLQLLYGSLESVKLGEEGDILQVDPATLPPCDGLVAGPPCPPWSSTGNLAGQDDARAQVFWKVLDMVRALASKDSFRFVVLENVPGLMKSIGGRPPAIDEFEHALRDAVGTGWVVDHWLLNAVDFGLAAQRRRVFIFAVRGPRPVQPDALPRNPLREFLIPNLPATCLEDLTPAMKTNLQEYKQLIDESLQDRLQHKSVLVCCSGRQGRLQKRVCFCA